MNNDGKIDGYVHDYIPRSDITCVECEGAPVGIRTNRYLFRCPVCWRYW